MFSLAGQPDGVDGAGRSAADDGKGIVTALPAGKFGDRGEDADLVGRPGAAAGQDQR